MDLFNFKAATQERDSIYERKKKMVPSKAVAYSRPVIALDEAFTFERLALKLSLGLHFFAHI